MALATETPKAADPWQAHQRALKAKRESDRLAARRRENVALGRALGEFFFTRCAARMRKRKRLTPATV